MASKKKVNPMTGMEVCIEAGDRAQRQREDDRDEALPISESEQIENWKRRAFLAEERIEGMREIMAAFGSGSGGAVSGWRRLSGRG